MKARHEFETQEEFVEYLRQYFAASAIQGLLASEDVDWNTDDTQIYERDDEGKIKYDEHGEPLFTVVETASQKRAAVAVEQAVDLIDELNKESK